MIADGNGFKLPISFKATKTVLFEEWKGIAHPPLPILVEDGVEYTFKKTEMQLGVMPLNTYVDQNGEIHKFYSYWLKEWVDNSLVEVFL